MSSGSFLKLWLLKGVEVRLISSVCVCLPPFCLSIPSWIPCSSSCTSGSLSSFFRFALLIEQSSENRLTRGRSDGDLSVVKSGLWISVDEREGWQGLKAGKQIGLRYWNLFACIKNKIQIVSRLICPNCCHPYFIWTSHFQGDFEILCWPAVASVFWEKDDKERNYRHNPKT